MRYLASVVLALATVSAPAAAWAQTPAPSRALELTFDNGLVTLVARGVTVPEIMGEWQRKGGSRMINAEKIIGGPVSYEFHNVPETVVLQSLLRSAAGFIAAPRRAGGPTGSSMIEQVMILAVSRPTAGAVVTVPTAQAPNPYQQPPPPYQQPPLSGSPDDDIPPARATPMPAAQTPSSQPSIAGVGTSATPGVVVPVLGPAKPGTPVTPGTIIKSPNQ